MPARVSSPTPRRKTKHPAQEVVYRAAAATGNACPGKTACTTSDHGRIVQRSFFADDREDDREKVRGYHTTETDRQAMRKRQVGGEPLCAAAQAWHGCRRVRRRGLENVTIEGLLVAAGQHLKRCLAASGWGKRHAPCGSLVALPRAPRSLAATSW